MAPPAKSVIVSGADSAFFSLLADLVFSIEDTGALAAADFCVLDFGLLDAQRDWLHQRGYATAQIKRPSLRVPADISTSPAILARTERPFLRDHFPGYKNYLWLDADIWLQSAEAVTGPLRLADQGFMAMATHSDRCYLQRTKGTRRWSRKRFALAFGDALAQDLTDLVLFNSGLLAFADSMPIWKPWADALQGVLDRQGDFMARNPEYFSDQAALNYVIWTGRMRVNPLPSRFNWLCHLAKPRSTGKNGPWVEPFWPHRKLYAIHLSGATYETMPQLRFPRDPERHKPPPAPNAD